MEIEENPNKPSICLFCNSEVVRLGKQHKKVCFCLLEKFKSKRKRFCEEDYLKIKTGGRNKCYRAYANYFLKERAMLKAINNGLIKVTPEEKKQFYDSDAWRDIRFRVLEKYGRVCACCGARPPGVVIQVDHIRPLSKCWQARLDMDNLQVLCRDCNLGKSNKSQTDFRE